MALRRQQRRLFPRIPWPPQPPQPLLLDTPGDPHRSLRVRVGHPPGRRVEDSVCCLLSLAALGRSSRRYPIAPDGQIPNSVIRAVLDPIDQSDAADSQLTPMPAALRRRFLTRDATALAVAAASEDDFDEMLAWSWADSDEEDKDKDKDKESAGIPREILSEIAANKAPASAAAAAIEFAAPESRSVGDSVKKADAAGASAATAGATFSTGAKAAVGEPTCDLRAVLGESPVIEPVSGVTVTDVVSDQNVVKASEIMAAAAAAATSGELDDRMSWHGGVVGVEVRYGGSHSGVSASTLEIGGTEATKANDAGSSGSFADSRQELLAAAMEAERLTEEVFEVAENDAIKARASRPKGSDALMNEFQPAPSPEQAAASATAAAATSSTQLLPATQSQLHYGIRKSIPIADVYDLMDDHKLWKLVRNLPRIRPIDLEAIAARLRAARLSAYRTTAARLSYGGSASTARREATIAACSVGRIDGIQSSITRPTPPPPPAAVAMLAAPTPIAPPASWDSHERPSDSWPGHCRMERLARRGIGQAGLSAAAHLAREDLLAGRRILPRLSPPPAKPEKRRSRSAAVLS